MDNIIFLPVNGSNSNQDLPSLLSEEEAYDAYALALHRLETPSPHLAKMASSLAAVRTAMQSCGDLPDPALLSARAQQLRLSTPSSAVSDDLVNAACAAATSVLPHVTALTARVVDAGVERYRADTQSSSEFRATGRQLLGMAPNLVKLFL